MAKIIDQSTVIGANNWAAKLNRILVAVVFFGLLILPIAWFERASFAPMALQENRNLAPFPSNLSAHILQEFERWFSDRYGMRDALIYYGSRLQMARTGIPANQDVVISPSQWLFYDQYYVPGQPHFASLVGKDPLSSSQLADIRRNLLNIQRALTACKIPFYLVIAPDKQTVYSEKLGIYIPASTQSTADQFIAFLHRYAPDLRIIDLRQPLIEAKAVAAYELYKRTDTHWNSLGAFYGYRAIMLSLVRDGVLASAPWVDLHQWRVTQHPFDQGDIAINMLSLPGYFQDFDTRFDKLTLRQARQVSATMDAQSVSRQFTENPQGQGKLLLYRDSFAGELMPFLSEDFSHIWSYLGSTVDGTEIRRHSPSVVIVEIVERNIRALRNSSPRNLENICLP